MQNAWKVGLFVVFFGVLLVTAYSILGRSLFEPERLRVNAMFADAGGINPGAKVQMAGVTIGSVESVDLVSPREARLVLALKADSKVPAGSTAVLPTSLIGIGDNPVQLVPPAESSGAWLEGGETIQGKRLGALDGIAPDFAPNLNATLAELNKTLAAARGLVEDGDLRDQLVAVLQQATDTMERFGGLASTASSALNENRKSIATSLRTFALAMDDVRETTRLAAKLVADPRYKEQADEILASLTSTAKRADNLMANVEQIVADPELKNAIRKSATDVESITETGKGIATNAEKMTANGVVASENIVELTKKVNDLADDAKTVLERIKGFFDKPAGVGVLGNLETRADLFRQNVDDRNRVDFNARYPIPGGAIHAGVYDAFESNKLNLQIGKPFGKSGEYRYGVYAGKAGFGVEYPLTSKVKLRGDLYGLNDTRLDIRTEITLRNDILGYLGLDRVGDRNALSIGVGIKK